MISVEQKENVVYMKAKGKLDDEDYDKVLPLLRQTLDAYDQISWYIELEDFEGWTPHAFWRDISFALSNRMNLAKVAVVGKNKWHEAMAEVLEVFSANYVEYFDEDQKEKAKSWVQS
jgi:hypothetical protein